MPNTPSDRSNFVPPSTASWGHVPPDVPAGGGRREELDPLRKVRAADLPDGQDAERERPHKVAQGPFRQAVLLQEVLAPGLLRTQGEGQAQSREETLRAPPQGPAAHRPPAEEKLSVRAALRPIRLRASLWRNGAALPNKFEAPGRVLDLVFAGELTVA